MYALPKATWVTKISNAVDHGSNQRPCRAVKLKKGTIEFNAIKYSFSTQSIF